MYIKQNQVLSLFCADGDREKQVMRQKCMESRATCGNPTIKIISIEQKNRNAICFKHSKIGISCFIDIDRPF